MLMLRIAMLSANLPLVDVLANASLAQQEPAQGLYGAPWWVWLAVIAVVLLVIVLAWWLFRAAPRIPGTQPRPSPRDQGLPAGSDDAGTATPVIPSASMPNTPVVPVPPPQQAPASDNAAPGVPVTPEAAAPTRQPTTNAIVDDFEVIEGIGPKIAGVLRAAGIKTYDQLARTDTALLTQIAQDAGLRLADASTWQKQATLAAAGEWERLKELQAQLKAGRKV